MTKWACLILLFLTAHGESHYQIRNCPALNDSPHHRKENILSNLKGVSSNLGAAVPKSLTKWPKGNEFDGKYEVPYKFHKGISQRTKEAIYFGMVIVERGTNIIFRKKKKNDTDYIYFVHPSSDDICSSGVGVQKGKQVIQLASRCEQPYVVIHELLHAIGMDHEHQRRDRSISAGTWEYEKDLAPEQNIAALTPYDPFSIMHYALPPNGSLRVEDNWSAEDTQLARVISMFPSICDYSGINQIYKGHVKAPPCTDPRIRPLLLQATGVGSQKWKKRVPNTVKTGHDMTWACNYLSSKRLEKVVLFNYARSARTLCRFPSNSMYPSFWWIPYAEKITYPIPGLNYSAFKTFPQEVTPNWMTHDICDCLGPPPPFINGLNDHSMYQICLECVHFKDTTTDVLKCIARRSKEYTIVLSYLQDTYNTTQYYLINPNTTQPVTRLFS